MNILPLPKIKRIEKLPLGVEDEHLAKSTKATFSTTLLSRGDYLNIFKNCNVLFIGDNSIRTLFRDLCKSLKYGRLLDYTEVAKQNGNYKPIEDETILLSEGKIGTNSYRDIHQFILKENTTTLFYIYLNSLMNDDYATELQFFKEKHPSLSIDLVISCSFSSDINEQKINLSNMSFNTYFDTYTTKLSDFLEYLRMFCHGSNRSCSDFLWMTPLPINPLDTSDKQREQFENMLRDLDSIIRYNNFTKFDRFDIWQRRKDLLINSTAHFSLHGIREIMDSVSRTFGQKHGRSFTPSIPTTNSAFVSQSSFDSSSSGGGGGGKWPKSSSARSSSTTTASTHFRPY